ncbi:hypothetical protein HY605_00175, partial [Candidatus Peregrinibacteria bacterium]|nr:hypothetical protein [Candidatus Peregrinibacteria bacterium]
MKQNDRTSCVYCGSKTNITSDHIPPKCLFREREGLQLITVPACDKCNNFYGKDDEYFRIYVSGDISRNEQGDKLWYEKVMGSTFRRSPKLRKNIVANISEDIKVSNGTASKKKKLNLDASRINNVLIRIVKGLYWHHYNECLPSNILFEVYQNPPIDDGSKDILLRTNLRMIGNEEFKYRYRRCDDDNFTSVWGLSFFMGAHFLVFTN